MVENDIGLDENLLQSESKTISVLTTALSVWAVLITVGVVALLAVIFRRLRQGRQGHTSSDSDEEIGPDDDGLSESSSVIDLRVADLDLGEGEGYPNDYHEGVENAGYDLEEGKFPSLEDVSTDNQHSNVEGNFSSEKVGRDLNGHFVPEVFHTGTQEPTYSVKEDCENAGKGRNVKGKWKKKFWLFHRP